MSWLGQWWRAQRLARTRRVLQQHGLTAVRLKIVAGSSYIETVDGTFIKLGRETKEIRA